MSKILFSTMEIGRTYQSDYLLMNVTEKVAKNGNPFVTMTFSDGEGTLDANMFQTAMDDVQMHIKKIVNVTLACSEYNGSASYTVKKVSASPNADIGEFILKAPIDSVAMYDEIMKYIRSCKSDCRVIAINLFEQNKEKLMYWSAAKSMHHNIYGGLLYHTLRMVRNAHNICKTYPALNRDLLVLGCVLHDIGKLQELDTDELGVADYSIAGNLFGHLLLGVQMVANEAAKGDYNPEEVMLLEHMIASHHGKLEYDAIKTPRTIEAQVLHYIDDMDAKIYAFETGLDSVEPGAMGQGNLMLGNAKIYKPLV